MPADVGEPSECRSAKTAAPAGTSIDPININRRRPTRRKLRDAMVAPIGHPSITIVSASPATTGD